MPVHHLMVGTWTPPGAIFTFAFDDVALTLRLVKRIAIPHDEPISWMTFGVSPLQPRHVYSTSQLASTSTTREPSTAPPARSGPAMPSSRPRPSSTRLPFPCPTTVRGTYPLPVSYTNFSSPILAKAHSHGADTRAIFLLASPSPPHAVYCNPFYSHAGAGSVFSVDPASGALAENVQNFAYRPDSSVHGTAFHPDGLHLYSADLTANKIWVHRRRSDRGSPSPELDLVGLVDAPDPRDHPRWLALHPSGRALYVLMEAGNRVCQYAVSSSSPLPVFTGRHFSLVPPDQGHHVFTRYRADVCALSHSATCLFASTRASSPDRPGYLAAFELGPDGRLERQLLLQPTATSGGHSNALSPSDWTDEWLALVEDQSGFLDIHRWHHHTLESVARVQVSEPGFGMNAIWYD